MLTRLLAGCTRVSPALRLPRSSWSVLNPRPRFCSTHVADLPKMVAQVSEKKDDWAALPVATKTKLLGEMLQIFATMDHEAWARDALKAEGYDVVQPDVLLGVEMIKNTRIISADIENLIESFATCADRELSTTGRRRVEACESFLRNQRLDRLVPLQVARHRCTASRADSRGHWRSIDCERLSSPHVRYPRANGGLAS